MSFIYQGLDTCGFDKEVQPCKEFIHSFIKFILSIHHSSYCILFLKMLYPMFQNAVSTIPYCCIPESLYPCYHVTMYPCIPVSLYPCIPVSYLVWKKYVTAEMLDESQSLPPLVSHEADRGLVNHLVQDHQVVIL